MLSGFTAAAATAQISTAAVLLAFYAGPALVINATCGRTLLPLFGEA